MDQDRIQSNQFDQAMATSTLEVNPADVATTTSRPTTPLIVEDIGSNDDARDVTAPSPVAVGIEAMLLSALRDKDHDDSSSVRSFSSQEDLLDRLGDLESDPELQESEPPEVADHKISGSKTSEITVNPAPSGDEEALTSEGHEIEPGDQAEASPQDETIIDYDADNESDDELNATVIAAQGAQPGVVDTGAIETMHIVHPNGDLNQAVAETSDEVLKVIEEQVPHTNLSPGAIVNEVEAVQVTEPDGASSIIMVSGKDWYLLTEDNGTSLKVIQTNEDGTSKMVLQNGQEVPLTKPFPFVTTFVGEGDG